MSSSGQQHPTLDVVLARGLRADRVRHVEHLERRPAEYADWPDWADPLVVSAFQLSGVLRPWRHQVQAADLVHDGEHTVLATGTASGSRSRTTGTSGIRP